MAYTRPIVVMVIPSTDQIKRGSIRMYIKSCEQWWKQIQTRVRREYRYTGTARQVTYGNLSYYNSQEAIDYRAGGTSNICRTGIYPENVVLYTTICDETALSNCSVIDSVVPTSQFITYEVDLKVNGFDNTAVDPGSNVNLSWSTTDPAVTSCVASVDWSGNKELGGAQSEIIPVTPANIPAYSYYRELFMERQVLEAPIVLRERRPVLRNRILLFSMGQ